MLNDPAAKKQLQNELVGNEYTSENVSGQSRIRKRRGSIIGSAYVPSDAL